MSDTSTEMISRASYAYSKIKSVFRFAFHWGFIPSIIILGLSVPYTAHQQNSEVQVYPSLYELLVPVAYNPETSKPQFLLPW